MKLPKINLENNKREGKPRIWRTCLRLLVCIAILWFIISRIDLAEVYQLMMMVSVKAFVLALFIYFIAQLLFTLRWNKILQALQVNTSLIKLLPLQFIGLFFNLFLPTSAGGDFVKAYYISKDTGKTGTSFLSVFLDRYIGLLAIIASATVAALAARLSINGVTVYHWVLLIFVAVIILSVLLSTDFARRLNRFFGTRLESIQNIISLINESSKTILKNQGVMIWAFLLSLFFLLLVVGINYIFIISIGKSVGLKDLFVFIPLIALAASLPISINGLGLREGMYVYLFSSVGFTAEESLSLALLNFAILLLISLPGAPVYLLIGRGKGKPPSGYKKDKS